MAYPTSAHTGDIGAIRAQLVVWYHPVHQTQPQRLVAHNSSQPKSYLELILRCWTRQIGATIVLPAGQFENCRV